MKRINSNQLFVIERVKFGAKTCTVEQRYKFYTEIASGIEILMLSFIWLVQYIDTGMAFVISVNHHWNSILAGDMIEIKLS